VYSKLDLYRTSEVFSTYSKSQVYSKLDFYSKSQVYSTHSKSKVYSACSKRKVYITYSKRKVVNVKFMVKVKCIVHLAFDRSEVTLESEVTGWRRLIGSLIFIGHFP